MLFLFFLIVDLHFLFPEIIAKFFNSTAELAKPIIIPTNEAKSENETNSVITEAKISNHSM